MNRGSIMKRVGIYLASFDGRPDDGEPAARAWRWLLLGRDGRLSVSMRTPASAAPRVGPSAPPLICQLLWRRPSLERRPGTPELMLRCLKGAERSHRQAPGQGWIWTYQIQTRGVRSTASAFGQYAGRSRSRCSRSGEFSGASASLGLGTQRRTNSRPATSIPTAHESPTLIALPRTRTTLWAVAGASIARPPIPQDN